MAYAYIDFETTFSRQVSLTAMPVRDYLTHPQTKMLSLALAIDHHPVVVTSNPSVACRWLTQATAQGHTIVAHNASFDVRVLTILLGLPWPPVIHCTMELAQAWSPNQPGGYSLDNLAKCWLGQTLQKAKIDLATCTQAELEAYCAQDVEVCRALHREALARVSTAELRIHEMTQAVKELAFDVDVAAVAQAVNGFSAQAKLAASDAARLLGDDGAVGYDAGIPRSVKPHEAKRLLLENLGFQAQTISVKKLNPEKLRQAPDAALAIEALAQTNKALSNRRRVGTFAHTSRIDCELTYFAAHTGRWSSRNSGKGLNLHNLPKRNPLVAKPVRQLFVLPDDLCFVRGDFANVEYRVEGLLTGCQYVIDLFTKDVNADPYAKFWTMATGQPCDKSVKADVPKRQLAKAAVLGLGFCIAKDTPILTHRGWKPIQDITTEDMLWDGEKYVAHHGVVANGRKNVINLNGTWLTEDHRVWTRLGWMSAGAIAGAPHIAPPGWERSSADGRLYALNTSWGLSGVSAFGVRAAPADPCGLTDCSTGSPLSAVPAPIHGSVNAVGLLGNTQTSSPTPACASGGSQRGTTCESVVSGGGTSLPTDTRDVESRYGLPTVGPSSATSSPCLDGTTGRCISTVSTPMDTTSREICGWSHHPWQPVTMEVYDILDVGDLNRFQAGDLLVHNCMGLQRWMEELARGLSDPTFGVTLADLDAVCQSSGWTSPTDRRAKAAMTKLGVPWQVAAVAYHTRELFHELHPEFARAARWLETAVGRVAGAVDPVAALAWAQSLPQALDPRLVGLSVDDTIQGRSVRVRCGHWGSPTVTWRDLLVRDTPFGAGLTFVRAGNRPPARTTINVLIENITQSAARNALCCGLLELDRRGYPYVLHVHDEVMLLVPRTRDAVLQAKQDMIEVFGPGGHVACLGWDWSAIIKPGDITMSRTLYEDEGWAKSAWTRLAQGDLSVFKELP